ncbi:hypothetical protein V8C86DRAFT_2513122 [Haematococcus lacustris]
MRGSLALLVGVLLFAAAGWAVGNKSEDYCTQYAVNFGIKCMAEVDGALGSMGLPKGISLVSPLMDNQNLLNTMKELLDEEDRERNLYIAFEKVSPSAACCIAACEDNAQACGCRAAVGDPPAIVQRRLYNRVISLFRIPCKYNLNCTRSVAATQKCSMAAAPAPSPSPGSASPGGKL